MHSLYHVIPYPISFLLSPPILLFQVCSVPFFQLFFHTLHPFHQFACPLFSSFIACACALQSVCVWALAYDRGAQVCKCASRMCHAPICLQKALYYITSAFCTVRRCWQMRVTQVCLLACLLYGFAFVSSLPRLTPSTLCASVPADGLALLVLPAASCSTVATLRSAWLQSQASDSSGSLAMRFLARVFLILCVSCVVLVFGGDMCVCPQTRLHPCQSLLLMPCGWKRVFEAWEGWITSRLTQRASEHAQLFTGSNKE